MASGSASFLRGLSVLSSVASAGEIRADDIAHDTGLPLSTVYRYLKVLREGDFVEERNESYVPGWRLLEISGQDLTHTRLVELGHEVLVDLRDATGETAVLTVRVGTQAMCLRQVESHHPMRLAFKINQLLPLHAGAGQRLLLAFAPSSVVHRVLDLPLRQMTSGTLDRDHVLAEINQIRRNGVSISHGEYYNNSVAVAVPVHANGEVVCALTLAGPENRCRKTWVKQALHCLRSSAEALGTSVEQQHRTPQG